MICENKQGNRLPVVLFVIGLIVWTTVVFEWFPFTSDRLIQVKTTETARQDLVKGDRDRLIEAKITVIKGSSFRDFDNWPLRTFAPIATAHL